LLDGACRIDEIMDTAMQNNMPAVAITDHGTMYGIVDFYKAARSRGIKPILGCEAYVAPGSRFDRKTNGPRAAVQHLVILAADTTGYHNLIKLISAAHLEGFYYKPRIDKEILAEYHDGLIGLSGCLKSGITSCLVNDDMNSAVKAAGEYAEIFGKQHFFLEVQDHQLPEQRKANKLMKELSRKTDLPIVATNDVHYLKREHAAAHEILLCLQTQTVTSDPKRMRYRTEEFYMKTGAEMDDIFREFPGALENTLEIAGRCNVEIEFGALHFPIFNVPEGTTQRKYLIDLGGKGLKHRYGIENPAHPKDSRDRGIVERFNHEMAVIEKTGYVNYYLVVWDFVQYARASDIPVGLRGSGGASLVAYAIGITDIDPLRYGLIFERFLNPERVSPPDFDIDFCQVRRGDVINYVKKKYGRENVAQIITFGSLGAKQVIRDIGRALEIPYSKCDRLSKMIPNDPKIKLKLALEMNPEFKKTHETDDDCRKILEHGFVLEGLYRNRGTHAAGVVIGEKPLVEIVPLSLDKDKQPITQYTMEPLGDIGLLKLDFLGLRTLTVMQETITLVKEFKGHEIDLDSLPQHDKAAYELLNRGDTVGVFQLESSGMRDLIRRVRTDRIEDLIAIIALYRPGPMNMLDDYVNRKTGKAKVKYDHASLEPLLKETYGVMLYQEQVQQAANVLAGYSLGEGDILRRAMGKKKMAEMEKQRAKFVEGCKKTSRMTARSAGKIFDTMVKFAGYGFNKSHSTAYALLAYRTAYLKANYPAEFMSALLSSEMGNSDKLPVLIVEAENMDLKIQPPDINLSGVRFSPSDNSIRFGIAGIKNVGEGAARAITDERTRNGPYTGLVDFFSRVDGQVVNRKAIESLIRSGAFDYLNTHRARLFNGIDFAMARAAEAVSDRRSGQGSLFELLEKPQEDTSENDLPDCEPWHESNLLSGERELLGIYMSGHPLTQYASLLEKYQLTTIQALAEVKDRTITRLGGIVSQVTRKTTKTSRETMALLHLEDLDGCIEVVAFPQVYQNYGTSIKQDNAILICGELSKREEQPKIIAYEIYPLSDAPKHFASRVSIHVPAAQLDDDKLERIRDILRMYPGTTPVVVCLQFPSGDKVFLDTDTAYMVNPEERLIRELDQELGKKSVFISVNQAPCLNARHTRERHRSEWNNNRKAT